MNKKQNSSHFFAWWVSIASCLISLVGFGLIVNTIGPFFEPISKSFHAGRASVALMTTLQNAAATITLLFAGKIMTKFNLRWLLTFCLTAIGISTLSLSVAQSLTHFYIAWTIIGICQPIAITLSIPVLLGNRFNKKLGTATGIALGVSASGGTIFNPIISDIITSFDWRGDFIHEGLLIPGILVPTTFFLREKPNKKHHAYGKVRNIPEKVLETTGISLKVVSETLVFYALAFAVLASQFISGSIRHISGHITSQGLPLTIGASVVSGVMLGAAAGKIPIGFMLDRFNTRLTLLIYPLFGLLGWGSETFFKASLPLITSVFILGLGQGVCLVALPYLIREEFGAKDYSTIPFVINTAGASAMFASVYLNDLLSDTTGPYNFGWAINSAAFTLSFTALFSTLEKQTTS